MAVDVSKIPNNNKFDPVREAILDLQGQLEDTGGSIGNGTLTVSTSGTLTGSGTFTANQSDNTTITIGIDDSTYLTSSDISDFITLTDLSVTTSATPSGGGALSYDDTTGVFTFTPADAGTGLTLQQVTANGNTTTYGISTGNITVQPSGTGSGVVTIQANSVGDARVDLTPGSTAGDGVIRTTIERGISFEPFNTEKVFIASDGNMNVYEKLAVGKTTAASTYHLEVNGTALANNFITSMTASGTTYTGTVSQYYNALQIRTATGGTISIGGSGPMSVQNNVKIKNGDLEITRVISGNGISYPLTIQVDDTGNNVNQIIGDGVGLQFKLANNDTAGGSFLGGSIAAVRESATDSDSSTSLEFYTSNNDETLDKQLTINSSGTVTANAFVGDGSGLTNLTIPSLDLQDVTDNGATTTNSVYFDGDQKGLRFGTTSTVYGSVYWDSTLDGVIMQQTQGTDWTRLKVGDVSTGNYKFEILGGDSTNSGEFNATGWTSLFTIDGDGHINITGNADVSGRVVADRVRINRGNEIMLEMQDSGGDYTGYLTMNDGQGNMQLMLGVDGVAQHIVTGDGAAKLLYSAHGQDGVISLNAAQTGTAGDTVTFSIGLSVNANDNTIKVGNPNDKYGLDNTDGNTVFNASGDLFTTKINARTGTEVLFNDTLRIDASGVPQLILDGGSDTTGDIVIPDGEILQVGHWNSSTSTYTDRFRIDSNGKVGIGTTSPSYKLDVSGNARVTTGLFLNRTAGQPNIKGTGEGHIVIDALDNSHNVYLNNYVSGNVLLANGGGNVGIGTASPLTKLHIVGNSSFPQVRINDDTGGGESGIRFRSNNGTNGLHSDIFVQRTGNETGRMGFRVPYNQERLTILHTGNVGIGTTAPSENLHIYSSASDIKVESSTAGSSSRLMLKTTSREWRIGTYSGLDNGFWLYDATAGSYRMLVDSSGNLGIGTTSPSQKLQVLGNGLFSSNGSTPDSTTGTYEEGVTITGGNQRLVIDVSNTTNGGAYLQTRHASTTYPWAYYVLKLNPLGGDVQIANATMHVDSTGTVGIGTTSPNFKLDVEHNGNGTNGIQVTNTSTGTSARAVVEFVSDSAQLDIYATGSNYSGVSGWNDAGVISTSTSSSNGLILNAQSNGITFQGGTATRMFISKDGNVGIGTTSPAVKLAVTGTIYASGGSAWNGGGTEGNKTDAGLIIDEGDYIYTRDASTYLRKLIGKSTDDYINIGESGTSLIDGIRFYSGSGTGTAQFRWFYNTSEIMRLNNTGLGIGTTSPDQKLEVNGNAHISYSLLGRGIRSSNRGELHLNATGAGDVSEIFFGYGDGYTENNIRWGISDRGTTNGLLNFYVGPAVHSSGAFASAMAINASGNVGIGTTAPSYRLHVDNDNANTNNAALYVRNPNSSTAAVIAQFVGDSDGLQIKNIGAGDYQIRNTQQGNAVDLYDGTGGVRIRYNNSVVVEVDSSGGMDVTGAVKASGDVIAYSSDERLKENVKPIENALDKLMQIKGVTFDWKDDINELGFEPRNRKNDVGVIAQDVEKVLPQLVAPAPFDKELDEEGNRISKSGQDYITVQYDRLNALLIEAIKEQQKQIDELKARLNGSTY